MIGAGSRKMSHCVVTSKMCVLFLKAEVNGNVARDHECPKNYTDSSKVMEADTALESYITIFQESHGTIAFQSIIADNDSSMRAIKAPATKRQRQFTSRDRRTLLVM